MDKIRSFSGLGRLRFAPLAVQKSGTELPAEDLGGGRGSGLKERTGWEIRRAS